MSNVKLEATPEAVETIQRMSNHVAKLGAYYGENSRQYRDAVQSFRTERLFQWGNISVSRDGDLSLFCRVLNPEGETGFVFGIIWHGQHRTCTEGECKAIGNDDGTVWSYYGASRIADHEHTWSYPLDAPQPGKWSFHS